MTRVGGAAFRVMAPLPGCRRGRSASSPPSVRRRLPFVLLLLAWLAANGAAWNVVQVVAWAKMFRDYSQVMPVGQALRLTFDGSAPCGLCSLAQAGAEATRQAGAKAVMGDSDRLVLAFHPAAPVVLAAPEPGWPGLVPAAGLVRTERVPVPPPRA